MKTLYSLRSEVVHAGKREVLWEDVNALQGVAEGVYRIVLERCDLSMTGCRNSRLIKGICRIKQPMMPARFRRRLDHESATTKQIPIGHQHACRRTLEATRQAAHPIKGIWIAEEAKEDGYRHHLLNIEHWLAPTPRVSHQVKITAII
ncbi:hypothetical protein [Sinorhizobium meliloti]|uniref:hypothetical protein n=1 Tax=Rhizobium meliloti TaxID=382 RepID=UPI0018658B57|nr:hypothetical protein [Sinorhizobium meliloti]